MEKILILTAVEKERQAVQRALDGENRIITAICGFGPVEAAVRASQEIMKHKPDLVINAGIAGGFPDRTNPGDIIIGKESILADLGAESENGFLSVEELGFGRSRWTSNIAEKIDLHKAKSGQILTMSTVTGTEKTKVALAERYPYALAEAMEGAGVAAAADYASIEFLEIRTISNLIGPRNREGWDIDTALYSLTKAVQHLKEVL